ncbi:hypothetical protein EJD98_21135 [Mycolicibacterium peregrinum]|uniref:Uncharacterized protein n=2 Tax=Mycolicibacterium peregrinum TaxID=43304 RepID=A0A4Z0HRX6_MYCPR|nr:hypothetical protein EJD98_21135 [Mycolicibacterium peregrinum]TGB39970.1 hypothetical protein EJD94_19640 [Mycolicibacterium peregrinum]
MATGYSGRMTRDDVPDEVPVADALEQQRDQTDAVPDAEAPVSDVDSPPLEATEPDWQEQREVVADDAGRDEFDREDDETLPG